jgi:hypothetical protein
MRSTQSVEATIAPHREARRKQSSLLLFQRSAREQDNPHTARLIYVYLSSHLHLAQVQVSLVNSQESHNYDSIIQNGLS